MVVNTPDNLILRNTLEYMLELNPTRNVSDNTCDWVIENFMDLARERGCKMEPHMIAKFFLKES